jgi:predicted Zn finger-like uncharacterized protein
VIIECPNCQAKYQYDEDRFERKSSKKIRCAKCSSIFEIFNPAFADKPAAAPAAAEKGDSTAMRKEPVKVQDTTAQSPLPKDEQRSTGAFNADMKMPPGKRLSLAIIEGPDAGNVYRIEKPRVTIGRSGADLTLNDTEASRLHAAVEIRDLIFHVNDLGSTNGTLMDGRRIAGPTELQNQSEFQVGSTTLMLIVTEDA